ncbi:MAG: hypothetical protein GY835_15760 [bacterium]|nr:hypothetical protein [bacterium]
MNNFGTILKRLIVCILISSFTLASIILILDADDGLLIYPKTLLFALLLAIFVSPLLYLLYRGYNRLPRTIFYTWFFVVVEIGAYGAGVVGNLILGEYDHLWNEEIGICLLFGLASSIAVASYFHLRGRLEHQIDLSREADLAREQARHHELEAKLSSLQAKMNPHFLFNCLNTAASLIGSDPPTAERYVVRLAELYRRVLSISDRALIPLSEELELITDYVELEGARFGEGLNLSVDCPVELQHWTIPGLLIEPLVENAIKHNRTRETLHIALSVRQNEGRVLITVEDDGVGFAPDWSGEGFGLKGVSERLKLLYGGDDRLRIDSTRGRGSTIILTLPIEPPTIWNRNRERAQ